MTWVSVGGRRRFAANVSIVVMMAVAMNARPIPLTKFGDSIGVRVVYPPLIISETTWYWITVVIMCGQVIGILGACGLVLSDVTDFGIQDLNDVLSSDFQQSVYVSPADDSRLVLEDLRV